MIAKYVRIKQEINLFSSMTKNNSSEELVYKRHTDMIQSASQGL